MHVNKIAYCLSFYIFPDDVIVINCQMELIIIDAKEYFHYCLAPYLIPNLLVITQQLFYLLSLAILITPFL